MPIRSRRHYRPENPRLASIAGLFSLLFLAGVPNVALAQWLVEPVLSAGYGYDDNPRLNSGGQSEASVDSFGAEVQARLSYASQLSRFSMTPMLRVSRYSDMSVFDSEDVFLKFDFNRSGQLSEFRFRGDISEESVRTAERSDVDFDVDDPDNIPADDSALVADTNDRLRIELHPDFRRRLSPKSSIGLGVRYLDLSYDEQVLDRLRDYSSTKVLGRYEYKLSERDTISLNAYHRNSEIKDGNDASGHGALVGYVRALSERSKLTFRAGFDATEDENGADQSNPIFEASFTRNYETSQLLASYRREISGGGAGVLSVRDAISINLTRYLNDRVSIGLGVRAYQTDALDSAVTTFDERDYVQARALLGWRVTRTFSIDFDYRYTYLDRSVNASDASSNRFNIWFRYSPKRQ